MVGGTDCERTKVSDVSSCHLVSRWPDLPRSGPVVDRSVPGWMVSFPSSNVLGHYTGIQVAVCIGPRRSDIQRRRV